MTALSVYEPPVHLATHRLSFEAQLKRREPCTYCGLRPTRRKRLTVDHVQPRGTGGENTMANIVGACPSCNGQKGHESLLIFLLHRDTPEEAI